VVLVTATVLDESSSSHLGLFRGCEEAVGGCLELEFSAAASRMCRMLLAKVAYASSEGWTGSSLRHITARASRVEELVVFAPASAVHSWLVL
jgi:hypothetical protein